MAKEKKEEKLKSQILLEDISKLEKERDVKMAEYKKAIAKEREVRETPSLADCLKIQRRDDKNSERKKLQKVTAMAQNALKKSK